MQLGITSGILIAYLLGLFLPWRILAVLGEVSGFLIPECLFPLDNEIFLLVDVELHCLSCKLLFQTNWKKFVI